MKKLVALITLTLITSSILVDPETALGQQPLRQPDMTIDASTRAQVIETALKRLNDSYVFPETAKLMETAIRERVSKKEYDQITSAETFAKTLTEHLQAVSKDKHLRVRYSHESIPESDGQDKEPTAEERERFRYFATRMNNGFDKVERLPGNIGYIDLRGFMDAESGADTVAAAMTFLANTDALIFDLRQNGGGSPEMVALISSYLFGNERVHLNSLYWREGNRTEEYWTNPSVPGKKYTGKDVYILTSHYTFSAAEEFTYNLKNLKRATIIGETTGGGAHPGGGRRLNEHFMMFVPTGRAINPISKTNWEGTGVKPDTEVPAEQALKTAHIAAMRKSLDKITDPQIKAGVQNQIETVDKELNELKAKKVSTKQ